MSFSRGVRMAGLRARGYLARDAAGEKRGMEHLASPRPENLPMPTFVQLRVTNLCNLRCKDVRAGGDTGIYAPTDSRPRRPTGNGSATASVT